MLQSPGPRAPEPNRNRPDGLGVENRGYDPGGGSTGCGARMAAPCATAVVPKVGGADFAERCGVAGVLWLVGVARCGLRACLFPTGTRLRPQMAAVRRRAEVGRPAIVLGESRTVAERDRPGSRRCRVWKAIYKGRECCQWCGRSSKTLQYRGQKQ